MIELLALLNLVVNGILLGGLFALMAFGLSIQVGIMNVVNVAYGDLIILAAYSSFVFFHYFGLDPLLSIVFVMIFMFCIGYVLQRFAVNKVLTFGGEQPVLLTFAISIIIQNLLLLLFTADARSLIPEYMIVNLNLGSLQISPRYLLGFTTSMIAFAVLYMFFKKTFLGKAMRAVPYDKEAAEMIGISTKSVYNYSGAIALALAGVAGVMLGISFTFYPDTGPLYVLLSFGVVVLGGLGSIRGTLVGGFVVAEALMLAGHFLGSRYQLMTVYLIILLILYIRPQGLFGGRD